LDRPRTVGDQGATLPIASYDYIGTDRVLDRLYPQNGTRSTFLDDTGTVDIGYDGLRRPVVLRDLSTNPANPLVVGFTDTYDRVNNKLTEGKLHDPANSETYAYDSAYRLIAFQRASGGGAPSQGSWTLDGAGNWVQVDAETRQYSSNNEIISRTAGGTTTAVRSDDNGNAIDDGTYLHAYDAQDRMRSVTRKSDGATIAVYSYDALGRRVRKVVTNSDGQDGTTDFYLDNAQEIEQRNGTGALEQQYVYGLGID